jgi:hypothetical protein
VAILDVDFFEFYNDRRDHQTGDRLLKDAPPGGTNSQTATCSPATMARVRRHLTGRSDEEATANLGEAARGDTEPPDVLRRPRLLELHRKS